MTVSDGVNETVRDVGAVFRLNFIVGVTGNMGKVAFARLRLLSSTGLLLVSVVTDVVSGWSVVSSKTSSRVIFR